MVLEANVMTSRAAISLVFLFFEICVESNTVISVLTHFLKVTHWYHLASGIIGCHLHTIKFDERVHMT